MHSSSDPHRHILLKAHTIEAGTILFYPLNKEIENRITTENISNLTLKTGKTYHTESFIQEDYCSTYAFNDKPGNTFIENLKGDPTP